MSAEILAAFKLLDELLCRVGTESPGQSADGVDYHLEAVALVQAILCGTCNFGFVFHRLEELGGRSCEQLESARAGEAAALEEVARLEEERDDDRAEAKERCD